jgi:small conductance mechanosensitive channel
MSLIKDFVKALEPFVPTGITLCVVVLVVIAVRYVIDKRSLGAGQNLRRQVMTILLSFIGLLILIMIIPDQYLSETATGQLLSLIGILLSAAIALSSTTLIGNAMAGLMLRSVKSFRLGDFVRIGDHFGRVTERGLFHVEIQTEDRDLTTLPNLYMVTNPVKVILSSGTIVSAEVSLGYDIPNTDVEKCLKNAAANAGLSDPFVLIMELGDFSVTYRVSGMLTEVRHLISVQSRLRRMMLNSLHKLEWIIFIIRVIMMRSIIPRLRVKSSQEIYDGQGNTD